MRKLLVISLSLNVLLVAGYMLKDEGVQALGTPGRGAGGGEGTPSGNGDVNCDGALDISDAVQILGYLFLGGTPPCSCECGAASPVCGNRVVELPEGCDDGNTADGDGCSATCQIESACGDGIVSGNERCDGENLDGHTCEEFGFSGGSLSCGPNCDIDTTGCVSSSVCGDFRVEGAETCDDGNTVNGDGCSATCQRESVCGDGIIEGAEQCDGNNLNGRSCQDFGFTSGSLSCGTNCDIDTSDCR